MLLMNCIRWDVKIMRVKDLLEVLWTDSVIVAKGQKILAEIETPHIG